MDRDLEDNLHAVLVVEHDSTAGLRSATFKVLGTNSEMLCQDVSSFLMPIEGSLAALASEPLVTTSSDSLRLGAALPPSWRVI